MDINSVLEEYCNNEMQKLKQICYPMIVKMGGISDKDYDDFYSIALEVLADSVFKFSDDKDCKFSTYLTGNISRRFKSELRDRNRNKRIAAKDIDSLSILICADGTPLSETIPSSFDTFEQACGSNISGTRVERYLNKLSKKQRKIILLLSDGYKAKEIQEMLHINSRVYNQNLSAIKCYENVKELLSNDN